MIDKSIIYEHCNTNVLWEEIIWARGFFDFVQFRFKEIDKKNGYNL